MKLRSLPKRQWVSATRTSSSFNIDTVTNDYVRRTEFASANYRKKGDLMRMVLPPPNVTGKLHLGHALTVAIEDAICRHHRAQGGSAHWIPGFDHAGIATQAVVEKELLKRRGLTKKDMSREEFINECTSWSQSCSTEIKQQLSRLGASLDWNVQYYTLDEKFSKSVNDAFCTLYEDGLIFRGERLVNWCPSLESTLSDQEVDKIDVTEQGIEIPIAGTSSKRLVTFGVMHVVRYKLVDSNEFIEVGTTRPETLFADVALAVHPDDPRYSRYVGKHVEHPVVEGLRIPIIADSAVVQAKATGVLKITPSHDPLDYEIAQRHNDEIEQANNGILKTSNCFGNVTCENAIFNGVDRFEVREKIIDHLKSLNRYSGTLAHSGAKVMLCSRTGDVVEPRIMSQWFLNTADLHQKSADAIRNGTIKVHPEYQAHRLLDWFDDHQPWCLSRQLLWGHRIPAYRDSQGNWTVARTEKEVERQVSGEFFQDSDVLDTWFSSSLVPLVTDDGLMKPEQSPLNIMETGWDISGFWVARMIAMNLRLSKGRPPFKTVVLHGLVRDNEGRKMSKSLGNVIDPLDVLDGVTREKMCKRIEQSNLIKEEIERACSDIEKRFPEGIPKCGPDALRFALLRYDVLSSDIPLDIVSTATEGLRFCNKLWNLATYYDTLAEKCEVIKDVDSDRPVDAWLLAKLAITISKVDEHMKNFALHSALTTLHQFITTDVCDVYLETTKKSLWANDIQRVKQVRSTLQRVLQPTLVQLSVFMPFVTEHLYERMFKREAGSINFDVVKPSLFIFHRNEELLDQMSVLVAACSTVRSLRTKLAISNKVEFEGILQVNDFMHSTPGELIDLAADVTPMCGLNVSHVIMNREARNVDEWTAMPVPGHQAKLWVKIEESSKKEYLEGLKKHLERIEDRERQFLEKAKTYDEIYERNSQDPKIKKGVLAKNLKKAEQSRKVAQSANAEADRVRKIIENSV